MHEIQEHPQAAAKPVADRPGAGLGLNEIFSAEMEAHVHDTVVRDRRHGLGLPLLYTGRSNEANACP
ncbi:hypothetical protein C6Y14_12315 [Streptomyces dioscori]|uniref:Uncharacterized protein n=1 Tax=Streptomyces dioscori TaxID=2109333 RepID=A0A2P8Q9M9_9ACTN|nr:hypothetical protein [Streptomyces dioscori]PSM42960.1 hypothetical protein C6Y14_12315 [Streptomyces dioscori]